MDNNEIIKWLTIIKINLKNFPEISNEKKITALENAIKIIERNKDYVPRTNNETTNKHLEFR
jgi:hypothetical protein